MMKSYLAIVDKHGLRALHEEHDHTFEFLSRQIQRPNQLPSVMVWAVLQSEFLRPIRYQLQLGRGLDAWLLLQTMSSQLGTLHVSENRRNRA